MSFVNDSLEDESALDSDLDLILAELDDLSAGSGDVGVFLAADEINRAELVDERLTNLIIEYQDADQCGDVPVMESLSTEFNSLMISIAVDPQTVTFESASTDLRAMTIQRSLQHAIRVSNESWSVKDLWDSAGAVERNIKELEAGLHKLAAVKGWYDENAVAINSLGLLTFFTINNKRVDNISRAVNHSSDILFKLWAAADAIFTSYNSLEKLLLNNHPMLIEDVQDMLAKVVAINNPAVGLHRELDGQVTMGNRSIQVTNKPIANPAVAELGHWSDSTSIRLVSSGSTPTNLSNRFNGVPAWLAGFLVGGAAGVAAGKSVTADSESKVAKGAVVFTGALSAGLLYGAASVAGLDAVSTGLKEKQFVSTNDMDSGLKSILGSANRAASYRRKYPATWNGQSKALQALSKHTDSVASNLSGEAKSLYLTLVRIAQNSHRLGWETATVAFDLSRLLVTGANTTVAKLVKAAKK